MIKFALWLVLHNLDVDHACHLLLSDWWSEGLVVEYAHTDTAGAVATARTSNDCLCLIRIPPHLMAVLDGRYFIGAGWLEEGQILLEQVCETFEGCVATRNES